MDFNKQLVVTKKSTQLDTPLLAACQPVLDALDSPHSRRAYGRALAEFIQWYRVGGYKFSEYAPATVDYAVVTRWRKELVDNPKLSAQSVNQRLAALRALVRSLAVRQYISHEQAAAICAIKSVKAQGVRAGVWLSAVEVEQLLAAVPKHTVRGVRNAAMLRLMLCCGLRRGDICALRGRDLQMVGGRWALVNIVGKGGRVGTVPVAGWAVDAIHKWWAVRAGVNEWAEPDNEGLPMFTTVRWAVDPTLPIGPQTVADIVEACGGLIGRPKLRPHDLRRTFAQHALKDGGDIHQIQMSLRHANLATTNEYLGSQQDMHRAPCDLLKWQVPPVDMTGVESLLKPNGPAGVDSADSD